MHQLKEIDLRNYDRLFTLALFAKLCCICHAIDAIGDIPLKRQSFRLEEKTEAESIDTNTCRIYYEKREQERE